MNSSSNYYLERVGFEAKVNLRLSLKNGKNLIGRSDTQGVDIGINSSFCSGRHCIIDVTDDTVYIEDLQSSNGTTVNGTKRRGEKILLDERDLIGIVGGSNAMSELIGNYSFIVYRLCKYTSDNIQTFEIEDDDPIELSDDEDNVIWLDSDGESFDIKEEYDLDIQLSRNFNIEIKKELEDLDLDYEAVCMQLKKERYDLPPTDTNENIDDFNEDLNESNEKICAVDYTMDDSQQDVLVDDNGNDSDDSNQTVCFSTSNEHSKNHDDFPDSCDSAAPLSDQTNLDSNLKSKDLESKLMEAVTKINDTEEKKRKRGPEMIYAKPLERWHKTKSGDRHQNGKRRFETVVKEEKKKKLKSLAETSPKVKVDEEKPAIQTTPKVKFTPHNRGFFLTDVTQMPALPSEILPKHKVKDEVKHSPEKVKLSPEKVSLSTIPTPPELEQQILENMDYYTAPQQPIHLQNSQISGAKFIESSKPVIEFKPAMEIDYASDEDSGTCDTDSVLNEDEGVSTFRDCQDDGVEIDQDENEEDEIVNESNDEDIMFKIIMQLPPETGTVKVYETKSKPANLKSILKSSQSTETNVDIQKRKVTFKESGFQYDPRHKIISDITSYDHEQYETVDAFCRSVDTNISSFADSYDDYEEYRSTLVSLTMIELWKEIELEYINSKIHAFTTVTINDTNLEKRGAGLRMVFHCQADSLYKSQTICDGHLVLAMCKHNEKEIKFLALITNIAYSKKIADQRLAHFTMETSALTEILPIQLLRIRPITVISNSLISFNSIYKLEHSPLMNLVINPLSEEIQSQPTPDNLIYKGYDPLDDTQRRILNKIYRRCINLSVPNISLLDGAAGTGKSCMIVNLALQLVYGDELPKPLRILICSKTNGSINDLTKKLINIRDNTLGTSKIQLVRFGLIEHMDSVVQRVSVQNLKEIEQHSPQYTSYEDLVNQRSTLQLKIAALNLDSSTDHSTHLKGLQKQLYKVNSVLNRFDGLEKKKLRDTTTFILNSCDIICTTVGLIPKLQNYVSNVDVCIIDEASQFNEPLTLLPFQFGMPSLVLVGDSQLVPLTAYSQVVKDMNYGNSLFARFQKLFLGKFGSPVFEMNFQYRIHQEILMWPNRQFYKSRLVPHAIVKDDSFPIAPYKLISYNLDKSMKESENIMLVIKVLMGHVDWNAHSFGMICTNFKQNSVLKNKLRDYPYITTSTAEHYMGEKDVVIIWISEEHGICHLAHQQILHGALTRAKKSLLICGANLTSYKNRPVWRSLLEDANQRKCLQHFKVLTAPKVCNTLRRNESRPRRNHCAACKF